MTDSSEIRRRVAQTLTQRRIELAPEYKNLRAFSRATGVNYKTLQRIESDADHRFSTGTLLELDQAYQLEFGSLQNMLDGGDPTPLQETPTHVPSGSRHPIETTTPELRLEGPPTLRDGEKLTAWALDAGHWHHRFETTAHGAPVLQVVTTLPHDLSLDEALKRLRMMARIARDDV